MFSFMFMPIFPFCLLISLANDHQVESGTHGRRRDAVPRCRLERRARAAGRVVVPSGARLAYPLVYLSTFFVLSCWRLY